jgi:hypothetical protein
LPFQAFSWGKFNFDPDLIPAGVYEGSARNGPVKAAGHVAIENRRIAAIDVVKKLYLEWIPKYFGNDIEIHIITPMTRGGAWARSA